MFVVGFGCGGGDDYVDVYEDFDVFGVMVGVDYCCVDVLY